MLTESASSNNVKTHFHSIGHHDIKPTRNILKLHRPMRYVSRQKKALRKPPKCKLFQTFLLKYLSHSFSPPFILSSILFSSTSELNCRLWRMDKGMIFLLPEQQTEVNIKLQLCNMKRTMKASIIQMSLPSQHHNAAQ